MRQLIFNSYLIEELCVIKNIMNEVSRNNEFNAFIDKAIKALKEEKRFNNLATL